MRREDRAGARPHAALTVDAVRSPATQATVRRQSPLLYVFLLTPVLYLLGLIGFPIVYNLLMSLQEVNLGNIDTLPGRLSPAELRRRAARSDVPQGFRQHLRVRDRQRGRPGRDRRAGGGRCSSRNFPGANFCAASCWSTWLLPALVVGTVWKWLFATQYGVVNFVLAALRLISKPVHWLSDPAMAMTALNISHIWFGMPFSMILIAAALTSIPHELYEAAALDGAGPVARFRFITLPAIMPALLAVACLVTIYVVARLRRHLRHDAWRPARLDQRPAAAVLPGFVPEFRFRASARRSALFAVRHRLRWSPWSMCARSDTGERAVSGPVHFRAGRGAGASDAHRRRRRRDLLCFRSTG